MENSTQPAKQDIIQDFFENFDSKLAYYILIRSKSFIIITAIISFLIPFFIVRYSTPIYETTAALIKKKESKNKLLDDKSADLLGTNNEEKINRDIQIIKSDYLLGVICDSLGLNVSYYRLGRLQFNKFEFLPSPLFQFNPDYKIFNSELLNTEMKLEIIDNTKFNLSYERAGNEVLLENIRFNAKVKNKDIAFQLQAKNPEVGNYIIVFNDRETVKTNLLTTLNVINSSPNIYFSMRSTNSYKSELMLHTVIKEFLKEDQKENSEKVINSLAYIESYIDTFSKQLRESQLEKTSFATQNNIYAPQLQLTSTLTKIEELKNKLEEASERLYVLEKVKYSILNNRNSELKLEGVEIDEALKRMVDEKNKLLFDYHSSHPVIKHIDKEIEIKIQANKNSIQNDIVTYQRKLNEIRGLEAEAIGELRNLPEKDMGYNKIQKEVEMKERYVLDLLEKQIQYLIFKSSISSDYQIIQPPKTNAEIVSPKKTVLYSVGLISFILITSLLLLVRYIRFDKIVSVEEVKRKTKVPILGYIPYVEEGYIKRNEEQKSPESRLVVIKNPKSRNAEVFKKMRASLKYTSMGDYKTVASTSTISGEGKTFVLINLAAVHALLDKKVIILDLDLRKPRISKSFKLDNSKGMSNLLSSKLPLDDYIQKNIALDNLDVITSGPIPPNPSELIVSDRFSELIDELKLRYDYIFIDTPPVGLVNESIEIINKVDIPLYLVRFNYSKKEFLNTLNEIAKLKKTNPIYLVINHFGDGASSYVNYNYGSYSYGSGYNSYSEYHSKHEGYYTEDGDIEMPSIIDKIVKFFNWKL